MLLGKVGLGGLAGAVTKAQGAVALLAGIALALSRDRGSLAALFSFALQIVTEENGLLERRSDRRSHAMNWLLLLIVGLTCLLMHSKQKSVVHRHSHHHLDRLRPSN